MKKIVLYLLLIIPTKILTTQDPCDTDYLSYTYIECEIKPFYRQQKSPDYLETHPRPLISVKKGISTNWCGYLAASDLNHPEHNSITAVEGTWVIPTILSAKQHTYCSIWIGIDGYNNNTVEQIGTEHEWIDGKQFNYAWFEMYPNRPFQITGFPVHPGDAISASITYINDDVFVLSIRNNTRNIYTIVPTSYTTMAGASRSSAEWVVEAPYSNKVLPLAQFSTINFSQCTAVISNIHGTISSSSWQHDAISMITSNNIKKATPSGLSNNGEGFSVTWAHE